MRFNPKARVDQSQIENRGGGGGGGLGGGRMQLPLPTGGGGKIGAGGLIIVVLFLVISTCMGGGPLGGNDGVTTPSDNTGDNAQCQTGADANASEDCAIDLFTTSVQAYWKTAYPEQTKKAYRVIKTVKFSGQTSSECGAASSAMGPFYCPNDERVYIDDTFMKEMFEGQLAAKGGPFALAYVIAHEYGHHIENQLGILGQIRTQQGPKSDGVRVELMADCLAGTWAKYAQTTKDADGNLIISDLTQDDIARAIDAAKAVGDDRIQKRSGGRVNEENFTHGSSQQRINWFNKGLQDGSIRACDTFSTDNL